VAGSQSSPAEKLFSARLAHLAIVAASMIPTMLDVLSETPFGILQNFAAAESERRKIACISIKIAKALGVTVAPRQRRRGDRVTPRVLRLRVLRALHSG